MKRALLLLFTLAFGCKDEDPPGIGDPDSGGGACEQNEDCPGGQICNGGVCEPVVQKDSGVDDSGVSGARMQVCTPEGCDEPLRMNFGGSRVGVRSEQTLIIRSIGEVPLELRNVEILEQGTEFSLDPGGDLNLTLDPSEEVAIRVAHVATDGIADNETIQIISNGEEARVLVQVLTEYKGVPSLFVGEQADSNVGDVLTVDFGNVRAGRTETRTLYLKNKDRVIDGSILGIDEIRTDPQTSTNFEISFDSALPAYLNQFNSLCDNDAVCDQSLGDTCDTALSVCRTSAGPLRDVLTLEVRFLGTTPGAIEERLVILSNDGGMGSAVRMVSLRATVTYADLDVSPDPVTFLEAFVGFSARQEVTIENLGTAPIMVSSIGLAAGSTFTLDLGSIALPLRVDPTQSSTFEVIYTPPAVGSHVDTLEIVSDEGAISVSVSGNAFIAPELELSETTIDFGDTHIQIGAQPSATRVVTARNVGGSELRVTSIAMGAGSAVGYTVDPTSLPPLQPGDMATFNVRYGPPTPSYPQVESGTVQLANNDPSQPNATIALSGRGTNPNALLIPGNQINFNTLPTNPNAPNIYFAQQLEGTITLINSGLGPLIITGAAIASDLRGAFSLVNAPAFPLSVPQGQNQVFTVRYQPPATGVDGAALQIQTNDLDQPGGIVSASLVASTITCPNRSNSTGLSNAGGTCSYTCAANWYDLNGDLTSATGNGCEYPCSFISMIDQPDDNFVDANCDGIDGDPANALFVAPPPVGNDGNPGSRAAPLARISTGISIAAGTGRAVYVSAGTPYAEGPLTLVNGVSVFGGYDAQSSWARSPFNTTTIVSATGVGVVASGISARTVFDRFEVLPGNAPVPGGAGPGLSSIGIDIRNSSNVEIRNCSVRAGNGSRGSNGGDGGDGTPGIAGTRALDGCDGCSTGGTGGFGGGGCLGNDGAFGGSGGYDNGNGGDGGNGIGAGGTQGFGGLGAQLCDSDACSGSCGRKGGEDGTVGQPGSTGGIGPGGGGGNGTGSVVGGVWQGGRGATGATGGAGGGGGSGGGGGGGADECEVDLGFAGCQGIDACNRDRGGGGGGGGGGGCGGSGGTGGYGGGGSFGIYVYNSSGLLVSNTITGGIGGAGGTGGAYGDGGLGGGAGGHGVGLDDGGSGGDGGIGGTGGRGGSGGGGGGGISYCIYRSASAGMTLTTNGCTQGTGGAGGAGGLLNGTGTGTPGNAGSFLP